MLLSEPIDDASHYVHESATNGSHLPAVYNRVQRRVEEKQSRCRAVGLTDQPQHQWQPGLVIMFSKVLATTQFSLWHGW